MEKELCCVNCPHCFVADDYERLFCDVTHSRILLEKSPEEIENMCPIRSIVKKNQESSHYQEGDYVELNDGRQFEIGLVHGYKWDIKEYKYSGTLYTGNHTFTGGYIEFKQSDIKKSLTRQELFHINKKL